MSRGEAAAPHKTLGTKVSEEEYAQLEAAASERGLTLSEWCREMLLASVNGQDLSDHFKSGQRLSLQKRPTEVAVQD